MIHGDHWHSCTWNGVGGMESTCCCILLLGAGYIDPYKSNWCDAFTSDIPAKTFWCPMFAFKGIFKFSQVCGQLTGQFETQPSHFFDHQRVRKFWRHRRGRSLPKLGSWLWNHADGVRGWVGGWWRGLKKYLPQKDWCLKTWIFGGYIL